MSFPEAIKLLRIELGITQSDLAQKLNKAYITVNRWENGKGFPSRKNARDIIDVARNNGASETCISYLNDVLSPEIKRISPASDYGFPDIDREFLFQIADNSANSLYIIEAGSYKMLYANRKAEKNAVNNLRKLGVNVAERRISELGDIRCFSYFTGQDSPCSICPLKYVGEDGKAERIITVPYTRCVYNVQVNLTKMKGRSVYVIYLTDITQRQTEMNALYELTNDIPGGVGIYSVYFDNRIKLEFMNSVLFQMIGEERRKAISEAKTSDFCLVHPDDKGRLLTEIKEAIAQKRSVEINMRMRMSDSRYHRVNLSARLIKSDREKFTFYCLFSFDDDKANTDENGGRIL